MRRQILAMIMAAAPALATAQAVDLQQATEMALASDPRIKEKQQLVEAARAQLDFVEGKGDLLFGLNSFLGVAPGVDGGIFADGAESCSGDCRLRDDLYDLNDGLSPWVSLQFSIIKPLYSFGKLENYRDAADAHIGVKQGDVRLTQAEIRVQVGQAYYGYLAARDSRYLLEDVQKRVQTAQELVERGLEEGTVRLADRYALESGKALLARYQAQARGLERVAEAGLKTLMGLPEEAELTLADRHIRPEPMPQASLDELVARALENRPEMAQVNDGLAAMRALVRGRQADKMPNLYAGVVGSLAYAPNRERLDNPYITDYYNHVAATPVVGLKWDWESGAQPATVRKAQAELAALVEKAEFARRGIPFEVADAYHQASALAEASEHMREASRSARRWMIATYTDFEAGVVEADKLVEAFKGYVMAHADYLKTVNDYNLKLLQLKRVTGDQ